MRIDATISLPLSNNAAEVELAIRSAREVEDRAGQLVNDLPLSDHPSLHPAWLRILEDGLGHKTFGIEAISEGRTVGFLPLAVVRSVLFGRFLVSLPYVNSAGVTAISDSIAKLLIDRAAEFANELDVRYVELRQEREV